MNKATIVLLVCLAISTYTARARPLPEECDPVPEIEQAVEDLIDVRTQTPEWREQNLELFSKGLSSRSVRDLIELLSYMGVDASKIALMFVRCPMDDIVKKVHDQRFMVARSMIVVFQKLDLDVFDTIQNFEELRDKMTANPDNSLVGMRKLEILDALLDEMRNSAPDWNSMDEYLKDIDNSYKACDPAVSDCIEIMLDHPLLDNPYHKQCARECDEHRVKFDGFCHLKCPTPLERTSSTRCIGYASEEDAPKIGLILQRMANSLSVGILKEQVSKDRRSMDLDQLTRRECPPDEFYRSE